MVKFKMYKLWVHLEEISVDENGNQLDINPRKLDDEYPPESAGTFNTPEEALNARDDRICLKVPDLQNTLMKFAQVPMTSIDENLLEVLKDHAWFIAANPKTLKREAIDLEFFICMDELDNIYNSEIYSDAICEAAMQLKKANEGAAYLQVIAQ